MAHWKWSLSRLGEMEVCRWGSHFPRRPWFGNCWIPGMEEQDEQFPGNHTRETNTEAWRDDSAVKNTGCPSTSLGSIPSTWLTAIYGPSSRELMLLMTLGTTHRVHRHTCGQNIHTRKMKINIFKKREYESKEEPSTFSPAPTFGKW